MAIAGDFVAMGSGRGAVQVRGAQIVHWFAAAVVPHDLEDLSKLHCRSSGHACPARGQVWNRRTKELQVLAKGGLATLLGKPGK